MSLWESLISLRTAFGPRWEERRDALLKQAGERPVGGEVVSTPRLGVIVGHRTLAKAIVDFAAVDGRDVTTVEVPLGLASALQRPKGDQERERALAELHRLPAGRNAVGGPTYAVVVLERARPGRSVQLRVNISEDAATWLDDESARTGESKSRLVDAAVLAAARKGGE